jgi:hypothetical protein
MKRPSLGNRTELVILAYVLCSPTMGVSDPESIILFLILYLHLNQDVVFFFLLRRFRNHQNTYAEYYHSQQYQDQIHVNSLLSGDQRLTQ